MTPRLLPTAPITDPRLRMKAIGLMVLATMCFAGLDATAKYLVTAKAVPVWQVTWLRFVGHIAFSAVVLWPFAFRPSLRSKKPLVQIIRSLIMIVTTGFNFVALQYLQLDQTVTIFFLAPLLVALLAGPLLNEWVGWHRMVAIVAGFLGVLLVMHPGIGTLHWAMLIALIATLGYTTMASFVGNWWYTAAFVTPRASAIICSDVPPTPCSANSSSAASAVRRCAGL